MTLDEQLAALILIGQESDPISVEDFYLSGDRAKIISLSASIRKSVPDLTRYSTEGQHGLIRAIAKLEDSVEGIGSVTSVHYLLPLVRDHREALLDWVLRNTNAYWYYSHGAISVAELNANKASAAARRSQRVREDLERQLSDKKRKIETATKNLANAVRRGDELAVEALLRKGASAEALTQDGETLLEMAQRSGNERVLKLLLQHRTKDQ